MPKIEIQLTECDKSLLNISASELIPMLTDNNDLQHVKQTAFGYYNKNASEFFQVQVIVTRDADSFLEDFQTEEMRKYNK